MATSEQRQKTDKQTERECALVAEFVQRQQFFTAPDFVDGFIERVVRSGTDGMACLQNLGRLRLLTSVMKVDVSSVLSNNIRSFSLSDNAQVCGMRLSIGNYGCEIMPGTYYCAIVFNGTKDKMVAVANYWYLRTLRKVMEEQKEGVAKVVFIIMVSAYSVLWLRHWKTHIMRHERLVLRQLDERPEACAGAARGELKHQARCFRNLYKGARKIEIESSRKES